jgi:hypothetical protein
VYIMNIFGIKMKITKRQFFKMMTVLTILIVIYFVVLKYNSEYVDPPFPPEAVF